MQHALQGAGAARPAEGAGAAWLQGLQDGLRVAGPAGLHTAAGPQLAFSVISIDFHWFSLVFGACLVRNLVF